MKNNRLQIRQFATNPVCAPYRLEIPGEAINRLEGADVIRYDGLGPVEINDILRHGDIFIVQRIPMGPDVRELFSILRKNRVLIVYDIDDDLLNLNPESRYAKKVPPDYARLISECIRASHAVQCSTPNLAEVMLDFHPEVRILENQMDRVYPFEREAMEREKTIIGYAAGQDHGLDWEIIREEYNRVTRDLESSGKRIETWIIGDRGIFDSLKTLNKRFFPVMPREKYLSILGKIDISLLPLADNKFNLSKSDVKFLESAAMGASVVASDIVYSSSIRPGETGMLFESSEEFGRQLRRLVTEQDLILEMAWKAHNYVEKNRLIRQHAFKWFETYREWYERRDELLANLMVA